MWPRSGSRWSSDLAAVYFDTAELALLRAGVSLRRRTGGEDEGWHLKLPAGTGRDELRLPLEAAGQAPPPELLERTRGWTRGAPVVAVATVETRRAERALRATDGRVLALLADDQVVGADLESGRSFAWQEWELELVDDGEPLLRAADDLMAGCGIPVSDVPRKILHVLGDRLGEPRPLAAGRPGPAGRPTSSSGDWPSRSRSCCAGTARCAPAARRACTRRGWPAAACAARSRRTARSWTARSPTRCVRSSSGSAGRSPTPGTPRSSGSGWPPCSTRSRRPLSTAARGPASRATYDERGRVAWAHAREVLDSERYFALLDTLERLVDDPPWTNRAARPADDVLRARVRRDWKRLRRSLAEAADAPDRDLGDAPGTQGRQALPLRRRGAAAGLGQGRAAAGQGRQAAHVPPRGPPGHGGEPPAPRGDRGRRPRPPPRAPSPGGGCTRVSRDAPSGSTATSTTSGRTCRGRSCGPGWADAPTSPARRWTC